MDSNLITTAFQVIIAIFIVIFLAYISLRFGNKLLLNNNSKNINIIDRVQLSNNSYLCIANILGSYYLIGVSPESINLLKELDKDEVLIELNKNNIEIVSFKDALIQNIAKMRK